MNAQDRIGMLVRIDSCIGCQACQVACREENGFGYDETWMELIRRKPQKVDGALRNFHVPAPHLDKCAACAVKEHRPLCTVVCPTSCIHVGTLSALGKIMEGPGHWNLSVR